MSGLRLSRAIGVFCGLTLKRTRGLQFSAVECYAAESCEKKMDSAFAKDESRTSQQKFTCLSTHEAHLGPCRLPRFCCATLIRALGTVCHNFAMAGAYPILFQRT